MLREKEDELRVLMSEKERIMEENAALKTVHHSEESVVDNNNHYKERSIGISLWIREAAKKSYFLNGRAGPLRPNPLELNGR